MSRVNRSSAASLIWKGWDVSRKYPLFCNSPCLQHLLCFTTLAVLEFHCAEKLPDPIARRNHQSPPRYLCHWCLKPKEKHALPGKETSWPCTTCHLIHANLSCPSNRNQVTVDHDFARIAGPSKMGSEDTSQVQPDLAIPGLFSGLKKTFIETYCIVWRSKQFRAWNDSRFPYSITRQCDMLGNIKKNYMLDL